MLQVVVYRASIVIKGIAELCGGETIAGSNKQLYTKVRFHRYDGSAQPLLGDKQLLSRFRFIPALLGI